MFIHPNHFIDNIKNNFMENRPDPQTLQYFDKLQQLSQGDDFHKAKYRSLSTNIKKFSAVELSVQPFIRRQIKNHLYINAFINTQPTEEGAKILDLFNPSYRVKRIEGLKLEDLRKATAFSAEATPFSDIFLDIISNEEKKLITMKMQLSD